jgi:hypothetical protein
MHFFFAVWTAIGIGFLVYGLGAGALYLFLRCADERPGAEPLCDQYPDEKF